jgi:hypothetical protein
MSFWKLLKCLSAAVVLFAAAFGTWYWFKSRPPQIPPPESRILFQGIHYERTILTRPRPVVVHTLHIDLTQPGIDFLVTPPDNAGKRPLKARKTSHFLEEHQAQLAINGDFFEPWHSLFIWDYYPHIGDPVQVLGMAASRGKIYAQGNERCPILVFDRHRQARIFHNPADLHKTWPQNRIFHAISGHRLLVRNGRSLSPSEWYKDHSHLHPRTALGLDRERRKLIIIVVDGRQPGYSEGVSFQELANLMLEAGAHTAMNMDGGGSTTLVMQGEDGKAEMLNSPIDNRIPGRERPVANHLAVFAQKNSE